MNGDRIVRAPERLLDGDVLDIRLTVKDGKYVTNKGATIAYLGTPEARHLRGGGTITRPVPAMKFQPGDVVVLRHLYGAPEFTYVRGAHGFLGDRAAAPTDREMATAFSEGRARLIARNGVAFPGPITRDNAHLITSIPF